MCAQGKFQQVSYGQAWSSYGQVWSSLVEPSNAPHGQSRSTWHGQTMVKLCSLLGSSLGSTPSVKVGHPCAHIHPCIRSHPLKVNQTFLHGQPRARGHLQLSFRVTQPCLGHPPHPRRPRPSLLQPQEGQPRSRWSTSRRHPRTSWTARSRRHPAHPSRSPSRWASVALIAGHPDL